MRKTLFLFLLLPSVLFAQKDENQHSYWMLKADSSCRPVSLPDVWRSDLYKVYELGRKSSSFYIVDHDSVYYKIFSRYGKDSLPVFDFNKQELIVGIACVYCSALGTMDGEPRHRNACGYADFWCVRDKKRT